MYSLSLLANVSQADFAHGYLAATLIQARSCQSSSSIIGKCPANSKEIRRDQEATKYHKEHAIACCPTYSHRPQTLRAPPRHAPWCRSWWPHHSYPEGTHSRASAGNCGAKWKIQNSLTSHCDLSRLLSAEIGKLIHRFSTWRHPTCNTNKSVAWFLPWIIFKGKIETNYWT